MAKAPDWIEGPYRRYLAQVRTLCRALAASDLSPYLKQCTPPRGGLAVCVREAAKLNRAAYMRQIAEGDPAAKPGPTLLEFLRP